MWMHLLERAGERLEAKSVTCRAAQVLRLDNEALTLTLGQIPR